MSDEFYGCNNCGIVNGTTYTQYFITSLNISDDKESEVYNKLGYMPKIGDMLNECDIDAMDELCLDFECEEKEYCSECNSEYEGFLAGSTK